MSDGQQCKIYEERLRGLDFFQLVKRAAGNLVEAFEILKDVKAKEVDFLELSAA